MDTSVWHASTFTIPMRLKGGKMDVVVETQVIIPQPLKYSAGSQIPFYIFLSTESSDTTPCVLLSRNLEVYLVQHCTLVSSPRSAPNRSSDMSGTDPSDYVDVLTKAKFSPTPGDDSALSSEAAGSGETVVLNGMIDVPRHAVPSFEFPLLNVEVSVFLLPPK
ncbi:hypothetical protein DL93DRAFT_928317 [Clavulina sp. PMI_390]|nr:hypothetical protein DL93DRAFT_928317 [Clavulina sp. PMI_390]